MTAPPLRQLDRDQAAILIVHPDPAVGEALRQCLAPLADTVLAAASGAEAVALAERQPVGCAVLDLQVLGPDLIAQLVSRQPAVSVLLLAAARERAAAAGWVERGALGVLAKPVDLVELQHAVQAALRRRDTAIESQQINRWLQEEVAVRTVELQRERANLQHLSVATLEALVNALEAKDPHLRGHSSRVSDLATRVAEALGLEPGEVDAVRVAGRLHDLGKIGIREAILGKEGPLTDREFEHVKEHAAIGAQILAPLTHLAQAIGYVRHHHERWDGTGYPDGLAGEAIPIGARIIGAVEIYDALTTSRPYQEIMTPPQAVERMRTLAGSTIDARVWEALARVAAGGPDQVGRGL